MRRPFLSAIFLFCFTSLVFGEGIPESITVRWNLYFGRESPSWIINNPDKIAKILNLTENLPKTNPPPGWSPAWGGFSFTLPHKTIVVKYGIVQITEGRAAGTNDHFKDTSGLELLLLTEAKDRKLGDFSVATKNLPENFLIDFYQLFLINDEFCLDTNETFLKNIKTDSLSPEERKLIAQKLEEFLLESQKRGFHNKREGCRVTGVAAEIAFLRLDAIRLLGQVGSKEDIQFIEKLPKDKKPYNHPVFSEACQEAVNGIVKRSQAG